MDEGDDQLWRRCTQGDRAAWIALVRRYHPAIRRFFVNKADRDCDDLTQATFRRIEEVKDRFEGRGSLRAFFFGVARNILREYVRSRVRDEVVDLDDVTAQALDPRPSSILCRRAEERIVLEALRRLSLDHQTVLELSYWEDLTDVEIAAVLEINPNTVRSRIHRAKQLLRTQIEALEVAEAPLPSTSADIEGWARAVARNLEAARAERPPEGADPNA